MYTNPNLGDCNRTWMRNHLVKLAEWSSCVMSTYMVQVTVCFYHVTYVFGVNLLSVMAWMSRNYLLQTGVISEN